MENPRTLYEATKDYISTEHLRLDPLALSTILQDEYFDRLWGVWEFILAKKACILVKDAWLRGLEHDWQNKIKTDLRATRNLHPLMGAYKSLGAAQMLDTRQYTHYHTDPIRYEPLEDFLMRYRDQECNDPRHQVYGVLGLADPKFKIAVDYRKFPQQVFTDAVLAIILDEAGPLPNQPLRWTRSGDLQPICELAERMGCTAPHFRSLRVLMNVLWKPIRRYAL